MMMRLTLGTTFLPSFPWELPVPLGGANLSCFPLWGKKIVILMIMMKIPFLMGREGKTFLKLARFLSPPLA